MYEVGDRVRVLDTIDLTDHPELDYVRGQRGTITGSDNFGKHNNPFTMWDVLIDANGATVPFFADELIRLRDSAVSR